MLTITTISRPGSYEVRITRDGQRIDGETAVYRRNLEKWFPEIEGVIALADGYRERARLASEPVQNISLDR